MVNLLKEEKGHAILEFGLSLFFLFTLTAGIVDFGSILNQYSAVTEAAHQGARFASGNSLLQTETSWDALTTSQKACPSGLPTTRIGSTKEAEEHKKIQERVDQLLRLEETTLDPDSLCITSELEPSGTDKNVVVTIQVAYQSILYGSFPIRAQARAPFLQN